VRRLLVGLLLAALTATPLGPLAAQTPGTGEGVNVVPVQGSAFRDPTGSFVELGEVELGRAVADAVLVRSTLREDVEVLLYGADAVPARGGGFGFDGRGEPAEQVGAWLRLDQPSVVVPAGGSVEVPFTVTVPPGTPGGEYVGAVVAEPADQAVGSGVGTVTRFAMSVYLRVPGGAAGATPGRGRPDGRFTASELELRKDGEAVCPVVTYRNESQDILDPVARVRVDGPLGRASGYEQKAGGVLPDTEATVVLPCLSRPPGPGTRVVVELETPRGEQRLEADAAWLPWPFVVASTSLLLLVLALLALLLRGLRRRRHAADRAPA
jgi:hypothetical protein